MNNADYWRGRFSIMADAAQKKADRCVADLEDMYREAEQAVQKDIESWYARFAVNNGLSLSDARKMLTTGQMEEFRWTIEKYIQVGEQANLSPEWLKKLENASARFHVSRLEAVQIQIQQQMELLYGNQVDSIDGLLKQVVSNGYNRTAFEVQKQIGLGWDITALDQKKLETLLSKPWTADNKTFRDRCWEGKANLVSGVQTSLTQGLLRGDSSQKITDDVKRRFNVSRYQAGRLVHTETTYFNAASARESYKELGVDKVEIIETLDSHTCDICGPLDGTVIPLSQFEPGVTVPPFHPNCRGTTAPAVSPDVIGERAARDQDGKVYYVPSNMKFTDWKQTFVQGGSKAGLTPATTGAILKGITELDKCTTTDEVEALMKQQGWFYQTANFNGNEMLSLQGCDLESAKAIYRSHERLFDKFPALKGKINSVNAMKLKSSTYAQCHVGFGRGGISVNTVHYKDAAKLAKSYEWDVACAWHPANTTWEGIVTHELGHAVDDLLSNGLKAFGRINGGRIKYASAALRPKVMKACGLKVSDTSTAVSRYASKDHFEWFAECFAEYLESPSPRPVALEFGKQLEEVMKGCGLMP